MKIRDLTEDTWKDSSGQDITSADGSPVKSGFDSPTPGAANTAQDPATPVAPGQDPLGDFSANALKNQQARDAAAPVATATPVNSPKLPVGTPLPSLTKPAPTNVAAPATTTSRWPAAAPAAAPAATKPNAWQDLYAQNKAVIGNNPNLIKPGQQLKMPNGSTYTVKPGDNLSKIASGSTTPANIAQAPAANKVVTPSATPSATPANTNYTDKLAGAESGGEKDPYKAVNPLSGATGKYQFMPNTFKGLVDQAKPGDPLYGKTWDEFKNNPQLQDASQEKLNKQLNTAFTKQGIPLTNTNQYLGHFLGQGMATNIIGHQQDKTPLQQFYRDQQDKNGNVVPNRFFQQNPQFNKNTTVADLKNWAAKKMA